MAVKSHSGHAQVACILCLHERRSASRKLSDFGQGVEQFCAGARLMGDQARGVSPVDAAACELEIVASAPGNAAKFHLTLAWRCVRVAFCGGQRQSDVSLDDSTNSAEGALSLCALSAG